MQETEEISVTDIAIIGMAGSFPGARDIEQFWQNIRAGYEAVSTFGDEEVLAAGIPASLVHHQDYVKAGGVLDDVELFDAAFFNYSPVEATLMDPQQRLFLECSYTALENAGYDPWRYAGRIGVYGGASTNTYLLLNLLPRFNLYLDSTRLLVGNEKDFLTSRVSFQLNLRGPSVSLQAGCATSLFAIHLACQALQNAECDIALAGGVSIVVPQKAGFLYREGGVWCSDGHCRAFDAKADGMFPGNGVGVVVLKRLADALADHDGIHALIKGSAVTNDGQTKMSFAAPSVQGEAMAVADALAIADINPETISYIEAHGTATPLGDPIEVAALSEVFQAATTRKQFCALGSVKTNIGHLDAAAGIAGLIKTVLALENKELPPSINFEQPNPRINFADSPFYVNTTLTPWQTDGTPRRAGVSSFSVGGHNAHIILQEAPSRPPSGPGRSWQLLLLSAKTASALETLTMNLAKALQVHPHLPLADVAYTLHIGRQVFPHRRAIICRDREDALSALTSRNPDVVFTAQQQQRSAQVAFLFPGQGAQYLQMARDLYQSEAVFRDCFDQCAELLEPWLHLNMRTLLYPDASSGEEASKQLNQVQYAQVALFVIEYALAQQWMAWGIQPAAMIGHSIGEYTAACLAGVFSLADALALVAYRGQLMQSVPPGAMLAVALPEKFARLLIDESLSIAAVNEPTQCVISGPISDIERLQHRLRAHGIEHQRLHVSHAMHSSMMDGIVNRFIERVRQKELKAPKIPFISSATGTWITAEEATSPAYWGQHLRQTVRFFDGLQTLLQEKVTVLLEVGPGRTLSTLARRHPALKNEQVVIQSIRHISEQKDDLAFLLTALGKLWLAGVAIDCAAFFADEQRYRVPLPTYPFEKQRYWLDPPATLENGLKQETIQEVRALETQQPGDTSTQVEAASQLSSNGRQHLQTTYVAPRNEKEQILVSIWQRFLGIEPVGIYDNFFELGGNSLMALQVNTEVRERFAVDLALQHFLTEAPTIIRLAETIEALQARKNGFQLASLPQERE